MKVTYASIPRIGMIRLYMAILAYVDSMLQLTTVDIAKVHQLTDRAYPYLHPDVRTYLNEQLLEARYRWEVDEWLERVELTAKYYEETRQSIAPRQRRDRKSSRTL